MIAITFALPEESKDLTQALCHPACTGSLIPRAILGNLGSREVLVVHTGMGSERTREQIARLWKDHPKGIQCVISAGYAGGLDPKLPAGAIILAENYSDPELLAAARATLGEGCSVVTMKSIDSALETCAEKAGLASATGAAAVDMETATIAALCRDHGTPLLSMRVISDSACEELAVPFSVCFDARTQCPRTASLLWFLARHPSRIPGFVQFVTGINRARRKLTHALLEVIKGMN